METRLGWLGSEGTRNTFVPFLVLALNRVSIYKYAVLRYHWPQKDNRIYILFWLPISLF